MATFTQGLQILFSVIAGIAVFMIHIQHAFPHDGGCAFESQKSRNIFAVSFTVPKTWMPSSQVMSRTYDFTMPDPPFPCAISILILIHGMIITAINLTFRAFGPCCDAARK
jgi:hypothetical protein